MLPSLQQGVRCREPPSSLCQTCRSRDVSLIIGWIKAAWLTANFDCTLEMWSLRKLKSQGSVIGTLLFLVIINDPRDGLPLFCRLFADTTKMKGNSLNVCLVQRGLDKMAAWAFQNAMLLSTAKSHFGLKSPPTLLFRNSISDAIPLPKVHGLFARPFTPDRRRGDKG